MVEVCVRCGGGGEGDTSTCAGDEAAGSRERPREDGAGILDRALTGAFFSGTLATSETAGGGAGVGYGASFLGSRLDSRRDVGSES